jgi:serine/threonine-protein kinase
MLGRTLDHYRIVAQLGAGGMGVVYRARDEKLDRDVALKVLPQGALSDEAARQRFRSEALSLSRLNHPHICTIYGVGEAEGQVYIAMEYVEGRSLQEAARPQGLPVETVLRYGAQIADALAHAHERGIVHRDLKSSNVMVTPEGRVKVLDFGLAKLGAREGLEEATVTEGLTAKGTIVGTLSYMPPEVLRGQTADARSDIWALGVVLYEMASGALPFGGNTGFEVTSAILKESPPPLPPRTPAGLRSVVGRCLAKEPGERYQRAGEVRAALEATESGTAAAPVVAGPREPGRARRWLAVAVLALALIALGVVLGRRRSGAGDAPQIRSLAVLPLENLSRDPQQEYFSDGMTEQLTADLATISSLRVISRTSVMMYKGERKKSLPQIARELGVDAVVEGSVLRSGERVRITAQLIEAKTDRHLWARSYERDLRDVLALQSEVARAIAGEIRAAVTPAEQARLSAARPVDPQAHELVLKGWYHTNRLLEKELDQGIELFQQAARRDPNFAPAYVGLAFAYSMLSSNYRAPLEVMPKAREAAEKAIQLDDKLAEAHVSLGMNRLLFGWDWPAAEKHLKRALELNPNSGDAHAGYATYLVTLARSDEAMPEWKRAIELDPKSLFFQMWLHWGLINARRYDEAVREGENLVKTASDFGPFHGQLALAYVLSGKPGAAVREAELAVKVDDSPIALAFLAHTYGSAGKRREAEKTLENLKAIAQNRYACAYEVAVAHVPLGRIDEALEWLRRSLAERGDCMVWLEVDPRWDEVRGDRRFQEIVRQVGIPRPRARIR